MFKRRIRAARFAPPRYALLAGPPAFGPTALAAGVIRIGGDVR
jgi:DNA helicase TIP49 (TBP-interacting protein)